MPNEVTYLLTIVNSYITCPTCQVTKEIEIILNCGHLICKSCKNKQTKCPTCFTKISATRKQAPSVKFIEELCEEVLKASAGNSLNDSIQQTKVFGKSTPTKIHKNTPKGTQTSRNKNNFPGTNRSDEVIKKSIKATSVQLPGQLVNDLVKSKTLKQNYISTSEETINVGHTEKNIKKISRSNGNIVGKKQSNEIHVDDTEIDDDVIFVGETIKEGIWKKNEKHKKKVMFYGNYNKQKDDSKVYQKILQDLGIEGIDKQVRKGVSNYRVNASEIEWNGQLNTFISLLNSQSPKDNTSETQTFNSSFKFMSNRDSSVKETYKHCNKKTKMSPIGNCLKDTDTFDLKRKTNNDSGSSSHLFSKKRQKVENKTERHNNSINNVNISDNKTAHDSKIRCYSNRGSLTTNKKLGEFVDETEIVQRYLNTSKKCNIENKTEQLKNVDHSCNNQVSIPISEETVLLNDLNKPPDDVNVPSTSNAKSRRLSKHKMGSIVSDKLSKQSEKTEEDELQSDIMADMLNNVSNEIIVIGSKLCTADSAKTRDYITSKIDGSDEVKNHSTNRSPVKPYVNEHSPNNTLNERKVEMSESCDVIVISDSEDEIEDQDNNLVSDSKIPKNNQTAINLQDINIKNCKVVIEDFVPLMFQSVDNSIYLNDSKNKSKNVSTVKQKQDSSVSKTSPGNTPIKNNDMHSDDKQNITNDDYEKSSMLTGFREPLKQSPKESKNIKNNFEGFTEQDILMLTVKLALFKMNGCKYSNNLSTSSLYTLDGKQILIKDMSGEEGFTESSFWEHKSSELTIEVSDSEDESSKSLVSSSVQTDNETTIVTPSPSTSKIRPVSIAKLRGLDRANEKFMQNDILDTRDPLSPSTPAEQEAVSSTLSPNSLAQRLTPVSRRQLSFLSPSFERSSQCQDNESIASSSKEMDIGCSSETLLCNGQQKKLKNCEEMSAVEGSSSNTCDDWQVLHYRMQYMMPNYTEESLHNELDRSGVRPTRLTFTTCGLNSKETALVTKLARMTKSCLTKDFTHDTTHLIIGATGRGTLEYYLAIAYRAFIVTMEWVTLCIALNKILPVTGFIPTDDEGPLKCLEPISPPFVGFYVSSKILPSTSNYPIAEITKTLLSLGGARMLADIDAFHSLQDVNFPRFFVFGASSQMTQAVIDKCASMHIVPVQFMWVYESVSAFRPLPVMDYLGTVIHSRTLIRDYRVPEHLACSRYPRLEGEFHPQILDERYQRSL